MELISAESMNLVFASRLCSKPGIYEDRSLFSRRQSRPSSPWTRCSLSICIQPGWVKSPVPTTWMPLAAAQAARLGGSRLLLVARE